MAFYVKEMLLNDVRIERDKYIKNDDVILRAFKKIHMRYK